VCDLETSHTRPCRRDGWRLAIIGIDRDGETAVNGGQAKGVKRLPVSPKANPDVDGQLKKESTRDPKQKMQGCHDRTLGWASNFSIRKFFALDNRWRRW
jgi:hypothetical protein